jgi:hypothetical protein
MRSSHFSILFAALFVFLFTDVAAARQAVEMSTKNCKRIVRQADSVDATYKPGVDAHGRKVVGADLGGGSKIKLPKKLSFDITADISSSLPSDTDAEPAVGKVEFDFGSKKLTFNGEPIGGQAESEILAKCRQMLKGGQ